MRIVIATHGFPPKEITGTEWHSYLLAKELSKRHDVYVFSRGSGEDYSEYEEEFDGIPIKRMSVPSSRPGLPDAYLDDRVALSFSEVLEDWDPDLIHVQHCIGLSMSILEVAVERRIPTLLFLHDFYFMCYRIRLLKPGGALCLGPKGERYCTNCILALDSSLRKAKARELGITRYRYASSILSKVNPIVVPSEFVKKTFQANFPGVREIRVSSLGLDLGLRRRFRKRRSEKLRFGYIGPIYPHKGVHLLISAFRELEQENTELRIYGGGDPDYLRALQERTSNANVVFFGPYRHDQLADVLSEIDVLVMPSICHESFSFTIRESLAVGIPVIVSDVGAQADAITEGLNGLHFKCGDAQDLRGKLKQATENPDLVTRLSANAKKTHIRDIHSQVEELESHYRTMVREGRKRHLAKAMGTRAFPTGRPLLNLLSYVRVLENARAHPPDPLSNLLHLYAVRTDLQKAFPEVRKGRYSQLVRWARDTITRGADGARNTLSEYAGWYQDNELLELYQRESWIRSLETELADIRSSLGSELSQRESRIRSLETELADIRSSLGYKFMKFYASGIDRIFPDGTTRGELRKIVVTSLRVITENGIRCFAAQAMEKIRRREFRIVNPLGERTVRRTLGHELPATTGLELKRPTQPDLLSDEGLSQELREFLSSNKNLVFLTYTSPLVSIVIVTYNKARYTLQCLRSVLADSLPSYEVIIVDNASSDETPALLSKLRNAIVIRNKENRFFAPACNQGGEKARGKYLLFLNADGFVHRGCVSWLTRTMESAPDIGAAGAKLVRRDGRLQEAGSIIWRDGSALGYGRGDDPSKPEYSYARDVDYCSAACLIVRRELFERLGGFDESFTPAYYEDTDLCMRIWDAGYRVMYQPMAVATHVEFASSSFESASRLMEKQRLTFLAKHSKALERRPGPSENGLIRARDRKSRPTILVIDDCVPKPEEGSGYPRMFLMLKSMASLGYRVTLLPLTDATAKQPETHLLTQMGVEILCGAIGAQQLLEDRRDSYDIALISRPHNALLLMSLVRETNPKARVIYDAEALWYRREQLRSRLGFRSADTRFATEEPEMSLIRSADYVTAVSPTEQRLIQEKLGEKERVILLGHPHSVAPTQTPFEDRHDLLFLAGFKSAPGPNDDAAIYFAKHLLPRIQDKIPGVRFIVAGSNPPESVKQLASDSILVLGYVKNLKELYEKARIFVVPTRFAAGIMWKVTEAMSHGLPCVLSTVAAQGLEIRDGEEALIAVDDDDFAKKAARLYQDMALWTRTREHELEYVAKNCDPAAMEKTLDDLLRRASQPVT